ncbi:family with sequence similarity 8 member A1 [Cricetulus griseus]
MLTNVSQFRIKTYDSEAQRALHNQEPTHAAVPPPTRLAPANAPEGRGFRFRWRIVDARRCCGGYREIICIWGAGGATPGKFLLGLRVVTCDTSVLIAPSRVLVIPSSNVSITTSTIRALIKNFSIASFFPAFITLLFFQHNRTAYDIVAGTIVVKRNGVR